MIEKMGLNVDYFRGIAIGLGACGAATGHRVTVGLAVILYGVVVTALGLLWMMTMEVVA